MQSQQQAEPVETLETKPNTVAPVETAPSEPAPQETAPEQDAAVETAPAETPAETAPVETATPDTSPAEAVPIEGVPAPIPATAPVPDDPAAPPSAAAVDIADIFSKVGDQLYEDCIFELSQEQIEVQYALIQSYIQQGATSAVARQLAANQIQPPKLSPKCEQVRREPEPPPVDWTTTTKPVPEKKPVIEAKPKQTVPEQPPPVIALAGKKGLAKWDCADGVDYVTIKLNGYDRKLTGGEICSPFQDVVHEVPASPTSFRLGYTIETGRLFVLSDDPSISGKTIAWGLSGRDVCRNNPDPDCFAARAVGPLPPGEYSFGGDKTQRVTWGPKTKRHVAGIYLKKLWNKERFSPSHTAAIMKRGNIAIHVRLKGEMSEACIGLEPKGWAYVAQLIKDGRATSLNVYIDEPYPQVAEAPPVIVASGFSLTSLFK